MKKGAFKQWFKEFFTQNVPLKLIALLVSFLIWIIFVNTQDPVATEVFKIPVEVVNLTKYEESGHCIELANGSKLTDLTLSVSVRGRLSAFKSLSNADITDVIFAYVDVYELENDHLNIHYSVAEDYADSLELVTLSNKKYLDVVTEDIVTKELSIELELSGTVANGYILGTDEGNISMAAGAMSAQKVEISGPASEITHYTACKAQLSVQDAKKDISTLIVLSFFDQNGAVISDKSDYFTQSVVAVSVTIPIYKISTLTLVPSVKGKAAQGWEYINDLKLSATEIKVYGKESILGDASRLELPVVDISKVKGKYEVTITLQDLLDDIYDGAVKIYGSVSKVTETLHTEEIVTEKIPLDAEICSLKNFNRTAFEAKYSIGMTFSEQLLISGRESLVRDAIEKITYSVDLISLLYQEKSQSFVVKFELPEGVSALNSPQLIIQLTEKTVNE